MTREEYEIAKNELINSLESELERLADAANVSYDSEEDIENIIDMMLKMLYLNYAK